MWLLDLLSGSLRFIIDIVSHCQLMKEILCLCVDSWCRLVWASYICHWQPFRYV